LWVFFVEIFLLILSWILVNLNFPEIFWKKFFLFQQQVNSSSANVRATVVTALRFLIAEQPRTSVDEHLRPVLGRFFAAIRDNDLNVRRVAIVTLNSAVHNKPKLIKEYLPSLLQALYEETKVKQELVREVEMGPFKHVVDDGLDLRKAAFEWWENLEFNLKNILGVEELDLINSYETWTFMKIFL